MNIMIVREEDDQDVGDNWPNNLWEDINDGGADLRQRHDGLDLGEEMILFRPNLERVLEEALDERKQKIIRMRYEQGATLKVIGDTFGIQRERVRQLIQWCLRRLRKPQYFYRLCAIPARQLWAADHQIVILKGENAELKTRVEMLSSTIELAKAKADWRSTMPLDTPVSQIGLSTRSKNALTRGGINTVEDLISHTGDELLAISRLGKTCLVDIKRTLERYGYELKPLGL